MDGPSSPTGSHGSLTSSNGGPLLAVKHAKLASEYSKLRAQFSVLKDAVRTEQDRAAAAEDRARALELSERKREAEMESVKFRNQQLTRRVQVLQEECDVQERKGQHGAKGNKAKAKGAAVEGSEQLNSVMGQELQSKIEENALLHAKLSEIDRKYEDVITAQNQRIRELESESKRTAQAARAEDTKQKDLLQGMREEKVGLLGHIRTLERDLVDAKDRITVLTVQLESASGVASPSAATVQSPVRAPARSAAPTGNGAFLPLSSNDVRVQSVELMSGFGETISEITAALSDVHTYWEHRLKDTHFDEPLTDNAARLSALLLQNVKHLKPVEAKFQEMLSKVLSRKGREGRGPFMTYITPFAQAFKDYVVYACGLEALTTTCLQQESNKPTCMPSQVTLNGQLSTCLRGYNRVMVRLSDYVVRLDGDNTEDDVENLENITAVLSELVKSASDLNSVYASKTADEADLPTVTDQLKNTNLCIANALGNLETSVSQLLRSLSESLPRIKTLLLTGKELASQPCPEEEEEDSESKKNKSAGDDGLSSAVKESLEEAEAELEYLRQEKGSLQKAMDELHQKYKTAEQNKEHWKLESQLTQMKLDKERSSKGETDQDKLFTEREADIRKPFDQRIAELVSDKMTADSKASSFYLECLALKRRMSHADKANSRLEATLVTANETAALLREESSAIASNYELQLSMMSEHVANMNEKLTEKSEQIETLRYELKGKKGKK